jgi:SRSO17 transposase
VGVLGNIVVWPPGTKPEVPAWSGRGRRATRLRRGGDNAEVVQLRTLAARLPDEMWRSVPWRAGVAEELCSRFAAVRVRPAQGDARRSEARGEHWLLVEWPHDAAEATKFWLSTLPEETPIADLVHLAKQRWLIERDYLELKQELGLGHYEGRGWRGFHHHAALCIAAYGFLVAERAAFPPPRAPAAAGWSRRLPFPAVSNPAAPPLRPERHVPHSIATLRRRIAHALAQLLPRCPCCHRSMPPPAARAGSNQFVTQ